MSRHTLEKPSYRALLFKMKMGLLNPKTRAFSRSLNDATHLSKEDLLALNWMRRKAIVEYAFDHVPLYTSLYSSAGYQNGDLKSDDDYQKLPPLEKHHIIEQSDDLFSKLADKKSARKVTTGGTTGLPLSVYSDPSIPLHVISWRALNRWTVDISDNSGYLYRAVPDRLGAIARTIAFFPTRRNFISASKMTEAEMMNFYRALDRNEPKYLVGYVGALDEFARFCNENNLSLTSLQAIWSTAAPLPNGTRQFLSSTLSAPVYSQYGSCEFYWIASECNAHSGLHIDTDIRHVESVDEDNLQLPPGESGDLLVTDMLNLTFPLIRYRLGDRGAVDLPDCICGLNLPLMTYVNGRTTDFVSLPNGRRVPGEFFTTIFDDFPSDIGAFNVRQDANYNLKVSYEPKSSNADNVINIVRQRLVAATESRIAITFVADGDTSHTAGKIRFVQSAIK